MYQPPSKGTLTAAATNPIDQVSLLGDDEIIKAFPEQLTVETFENLAKELIQNKKSKALTYFIREAYHTLEPHQYDILLSVLWNEIIAQNPSQLNQLGGVLEVLCDACLSDNALKAQVFRDILESRNLTLLRFIYDNSGWRLGTEMIYEHKNMLYLDDSEASRHFFIELIEFLKDYDFSPLRMLPDDLSRVWYRVKLFENPSQQSYNRYHEVDIDGTVQNRWYLNDAELLDIFSARSKPGYQFSEIDRSLVTTVFSHNHKDLLARLIMERYLGRKLDLHFGNPNHSETSFREDIASAFQAALDSPDGPLLHELKAYHPTGFEFKLSDQILYENTVQAAITFGFPEWIPRHLHHELSQEEFTRLISHPNSETTNSYFLSRIKVDYKKFLHGLIQVKNRIAFHERFFKAFPVLSHAERLEAIRVLGGNGFRNENLGLQFYRAITLPSTVNELIEIAQVFIESAFKHMNYDALICFKDLRIDVTDQEAKKGLTLLLQNLHITFFDFNEHKRFALVFNRMFPHLRIVFSGQSEAEKELQAAFNAVQGINGGLAIRIPSREIVKSEFESDAEFAKGVKSIYNVNAGAVTKTLDNKLVTDHDLIKLLDEYSDRIRGSGTVAPASFFEKAASNMRSLVLAELLHNFGTNENNLDAAWNALLTVKEPESAVRFNCTVKVLAKLSGPAMLRSIIDKAIEKTNFRIFRYLIVNKFVNVERLYNVKEWQRKLSLNYSYEGHKFIAKALLLLPLHGYSVQAFAPPLHQSNGQYWYNMIYNSLYEQKEKNSIKTLEARCSPDWDRDMLVSTFSYENVNYAHAPLVDYYRRKNPDWKTSPFFYELGTRSHAVPEADFKEVYFNVEDCINCGSVKALKLHTHLGLNDLSLNQLSRLIEHLNTAPIEKLELTRLAFNRISEILDKTTRDQARIDLVNSLVIGSALITEDFDTSILATASPDDVSALLLNYAKYYRRDVSHAHSQIIELLIIKAISENTLNENFLLSVVVKTLKQSFSSLNIQFAQILMANMNFREKEFDMLHVVIDEIRTGRYFDLAEQLRTGLRLASEEEAVAVLTDKHSMADLCDMFDISVKRLLEMFNRNDNLDSIIRYSIDDNGMES